MGWYFIDKEEAEDGEEQVRQQMKKQMKQGMRRKSWRSDSRGCCDTHGAFRRGYESGWRDRDECDCEDEEEEGYRGRRMHY